MQVCATYPGHPAPAKHLLHKLTKGLHLLTLPELISVARNSTVLNLPLPRPSYYRTAQKRHPEATWRKLPSSEAAVAGEAYLMQLRNPPARDLCLPPDYAKMYLMHYRQREMASPYSRALKKLRKRFIPHATKLGALVVYDTILPRQGYVALGMAWPSSYKRVPIAFDFVRRGDASVNTSRPTSSFGVRERIMNL